MSAEHSKAGLASPSSHCVLANGSPNTAVLPTEGTSKSHSTTTRRPCPKWPSLEKKANPMPAFTCQGEEGVFKNSMENMCSGGKKKKDEEPSFLKRIFFWGQHCDMVG